MAGFYTEPFRLNERLFRTEHDLTQATLGETLGATLDQTFAENPLQSLRNLGATDERPDVREQIFRGRGVDPESFGGRPLDEQVPRLSPEEANQRYGIPGALTFDAPVSEDIARLKRDAARERLQRQDVLRRASSDAGTIGAQFLTGLVASALDPLNVAAAFVPVVGPARYAIWAQRFGATRARLATGAIEGAVGTAALEPLILAGQSAIGNEDYSAVDSLLNITFGTILGGGLHVGLGRLGDALTTREVARRVQAMPAEVREAAVRTAIGQLAEGRRVDVDALVGRYFDEEFDRLLTRGADLEVTPRVGPSLTDAPPPREFELGELAGKGPRARYTDYTRVSDADRPFIEAVVAEVEQAQIGTRTAKIDPSQPMSPNFRNTLADAEVIGVKSTMPEWFQEANRGGAGLTREKVRAVGDKMLRGEPLGKAEGRIAAQIAAEARGMRAENVRQMVEFRERREREARESIEAIAARDAEAWEWDDAAEPEVSRRVDADNRLSKSGIGFDDEGVDDFLDELRTAGLLDEPTIAELDQLTTTAEAWGKGFRQAAACLTRNG